RQGDGEFGDRLQFAVLAALHGFEAMEFEAHDAVNDRHLAQSVAEIRGHCKPSLCCCISSLFALGGGEGRGEAEAPTWTRSATHLTLAPPARRAPPSPP